MESGKLDEELGRMSTIADLLHSDALMLFNESFAATNEREGSTIAGQITRALLERCVKVFFVTHQYEFARRMRDACGARALFLRAERQADGRRTFKLIPGEPLQTSYGQDLYKTIFAGAGQLSGSARWPSCSMRRNATRQLRGETDCGAALPGAVHATPGSLHPWPAARSECG